MERCPVCGADLLEGADYCVRCGTMVLRSADGRAVSVIQTPTRKSVSMKAAAVGIVLLLVIAGVAYYALSNYGHYAYIGIHVTSGHITEEVDIQVMVDGEVVMTVNDAEPGETYYREYYYRYDFGLLEDSDLVTVRAVSSGGGLGSVSQSEDLIVFHGERYTVDLLV